MFSADFRLRHVGKAFSHLTLSILVSACIFLSSCEEYAEQPSGHISFTPGIASLQTPTRSDTDTPQDTVITLRGGDNPLYLRVTYSDGINYPSTECNTDVSTRAEPVEEDNMYDKFGVSAYTCTGSWDENKTSNYFHNIDACKEGKSYELKPAHRWPGNPYKIKFFAYAPKDNANYVLSDKTHPGSPTIDVTIPEKVEKQKDLITAKTGELNGSGNASSSVPLNFKHALTAVRFVAGKHSRKNIRIGDKKYDPYIIGVKLNNVYSKGTYDTGTETWKVDKNSSKSFTRRLSQGGYRENEDITTKKETFMMIPQELPDDAEIQLVFEPDKENGQQISKPHPKSKSYSISGLKWPAGKTVTYEFSNILETHIGGKIRCSGGGGMGTGKLLIESYQQNNKTKKIKPLKWKAVGYCDDYDDDNTDENEWKPDKPSWLIYFSEAGNGGEKDTISIILKPFTDDDEGKYTKKLRSAAQKGTETSPYNLSNGSGKAEVENTANCYVIDAPGYYSIPLVYGNAIKDGKNNIPAYRPKHPEGKSQSGFLEIFFNHARQEITSPYIKDNAGCSPAKAELVWGDELNSVDYDGIKFNPEAFNGKGGISFKVDKDYIRESNAVIAIKDEEDNILWSWHIWITHKNIEKTFDLIDNDGTTYQFMRYNLGECDGRTFKYKERTFGVKIKAETGDEGIVKVKQKPTDPNMYNAQTNDHNCCYYQWGRKDPFPGLHTFSEGETRLTFIPRNLNKNVYDYGSEKLNNATLDDDTQSIIESITSPNKKYKNKSSVPFTNLWGRKQSSEDTTENIKTIYDPCPVGFKVPTVDILKTFTEPRDHCRRGQIKYAAWDKNEKYWVFTFCDDDHKINFLATGICNKTQANIVKNAGDYTGTGYWTANCTDNEETMFLKLAGDSNDNINLSFSTTKEGVALPIRPCKE